MATAGSGNGAAAGSGGGSAGGGGSSGSRLLKRYGPIALVVIIIAGVIAVVSIVNGGDDDDSGVSAGASTTVAGANSDLPLTFQEAKAQGKEGDINWGDGCNTETGRVKIPVSNAPPCVEPWDASKDNGGATAQGVTKDEILIALYKGQPDPLQQAIVEGAGADTDPEAVNQTSVDYLKMFEAVSQMYGRTLKIETIEATGGPTDATAAQADAQKVIDMKAFAAVGGPAQTPAWFQELVDRQDHVHVRDRAAAGRDRQVRSLPVAGRCDAGAGGRALRRARGQAARRQEGEVRGIHRHPEPDTSVRLGAGRDRDRPVQGPQRRLR